MTVVIGTVTVMMLGISLQSLIGNAIVGMALAIMRPFRIGDNITVFNITGMVYDIGLLYTTIITKEDDPVLLPNTLRLSSAVVREKQAGAQCQAA